VRVIAGSAGTFYGQPMTEGGLYTVAGDGNSGTAGDGGPATAAELYYPTGVAVDGHGNLLIADDATGRVRVVAARTGTFYGVAMVAGDIYRVAGGGSSGLGNGGPAVDAELPAPDWVTVDGAGNLLVDASGRVRIVGG